MKLVHVVEASFAGVGRHVQDLAEWQADSGHDVTVVYGAEREDTVFAARRETLVNIAWRQIKVSQMPSVRDLKAVRCIVRCCRGADIVHGHSTKGGLLARLAGLFNSASVVYTPNAFYTQNRLASVLRVRVVALLERALSYCTSSIVVVSPEEWSHAQYLKIPDKKLVLIPNGIDLQVTATRTAIRGQFGISESALLVGFVGRMDIQKSPVDLVKICQLVANRMDNVQFVIIGVGPLEAQVRELVNSKPETRDRFFLLGQQNGFAAMASFDVFLLPSLYEGFPYVLIEAAANALPIVTTVEAAASQIVIDSRNGYVCSAGDVPALAQKLMVLLENKEVRRAMGGESLYISKAFSVNVMCEGVMELYERLRADGSKLTKTK